MTVVVSTASILLQADETWGWENLAPLAGSWRNLFWDDGTDAVLWGRQFGKFNFDFVRINLKFTNLTPTLPENAVILSAVLRGTAQLTSTATPFISIVRTLTRDGIWVPDTTSGWKTASTVSGPHGTHRSAANVVVRNVIFTALVDTAVNTSHSWAIRDNANSRGLRAGQGVDIVTGGTLGFVDIELRREGTGGAGNIWCEIYSQTGAGLADTLLATSVVRPASDAPTSPGLLTFAFTGPEQIALSEAQKIVVVLNGDYPLSGTNNVAMRWTRGGYAIGTFQIDGEGKSWNSQNYPMQKTFQNVTGDGFVIWIPEQFFIGVDYDTPDLAAIVQNHILVSGYTEGDPFAFAVERSLFLSPQSTADRRWASVLHPTFQPVRLIITWQEPQPISLKLAGEVSQLSTFALVQVAKQIADVSTARAVAIVDESQLDADVELLELRATAKIMTVEAKVDPLVTVARVSEAEASSDVALEQTTAKVDESGVEADADTSYIRAKVEDC